MMDTRTPADVAAAIDTAPRRLAMLIYPGVTPLDVTGPLEVFSMANSLTRRTLYDIQTVGPTAEPIATRNGFALLPTCAMADVPEPIDTLLVAGGRGPDAVTSPEVFDWLRRMVPRARRYGSICTGAFVLGGAGLLAGKRVTTHWNQCRELARRNPTTQVEMDSIFIRDGRLYTSAGITAGIDLALAMVEEDHGRALALKVARYLVLFLKRAGGQAQFSTLLRAQFSAIPAIETLQQWCLDNLAADLSVTALSQQAGMSKRTFVRAFVKATGEPPGEFVASVRLQGACQLLEDTDLPLKAVAQRCGFGSADAMRRAFLQRISTTPGQYRERFSAKELLRA